MHDPEPEHEPTGFERRLARLRPAAPSLDRDRMLYEAGRAAARDRAWRATAAALAVVALGLGGLLVRERAGRRALEVALAAKGVEAVPPMPPIAPPNRSIEPGSYLALRRQLLAGRLDPPPGAGARPDDPDAPPPLRVRGRAVDL